MYLCQGDRVNFIIVRQSVSKFVNGEANSDFIQGLQKNDFYARLSLHYDIFKLILRRMHAFLTVLQETDTCT